MMRRAAFLSPGVAPAAIVVAALGLAALDAGHASAQQALVARPPAAAPNELDRLLARMDAEERALRAELDSVGPRLDLVRRRMVARGRAYYRLVRAGLLPVGGGFDALVDHAAQVERTRHAIERDAAEEAALMKRGAEIDARLTRLRAERAPLDVQREAMERARLALQEVDERKAAFARAFETSTRPDAVAIYGVDGPEGGDSARGFRSLKGRLPFPIAGRAEVHKLSHGGSPALEFTASGGAPVRAIAAGRVAFADRYEDYGLTVILDHGDHYYSVYANLGATDVRSGDQMATGARLGSVANAGGKAAAIYFELRRNAATLDPGPWLGL